MNAELKQQHDLLLEYAPNNIKQASTECHAVVIVVATAPEFREMGGWCGRALDHKSGNLSPSAATDSLGDFGHVSSLHILVSQPET